MTVIMNRWAAFIIKTGPDREKQNIVWNMIGSFCYAFASMVLSFLVMRVIGEEQGGIFAFGYSTFGQQMFILAYFGIRPYQITDGNYEYRFGDYLHHRYLTCGLAIGAAAVYLFFSGYTREKALIIFLLVCYKVADGFADVYESEFQRCGRLYLTGKSNTFRTLLSVGTFLAVLVPKKNLILACCAAVGAQAAGVLLFDVIVLGYLGNVNVQWARDRLKPLTAATILLFVSVFLDFYVFSAAKYAIDAHMDDASSGYFNVIFMPTSVINLAAGFVIRPVLTYLTDAWNERRFGHFSKRLILMTEIIGALSVLALILVTVLGKPVLWILEQLLGAEYSGKLTIYHHSFIMIVVGGAFYALLNLYYYVLVIMRKQKTIFGIYGVMAVAALVTAPLMVKRGGIDGAALAYLILMAVMTVGFVSGGWYGFLKGKREG